jgi:cell division protein FtsB
MREPVSMILTRSQYESAIRVLGKMQAQLKNLEAQRNELAAQVADLSKQIIRYENEGAVKAVESVA